MKPCLAALLLIASAAHAQAPGTTSMYATPDCGEWVSSPNPVHKAWLAGYMSAMNATLGAMAHKTDVLKQFKPPQIYSWMDNYCKANPLSDANEGGNKLWAELVQKARR
jgi:hypothetical protein